MSAVNAELFDGTQAPAPEQVYPDALAGLVTGESAQALDTFGGGYTDAYSAAPIAELVEPGETDPEALTALLDDDEDDAAAQDDAPNASSNVPGSSTGSNYTGSTPPGMLALPPRQPAGQRMRQAMRQSGSGVPRPPVTPATRSASGVVVAIVLLVIFGVIAIQVIAGIVEAITDFP